MKTIRSLMILSGLSVALIGLAVTNAKARVLYAPSFSGTITLPVETHWGAITLPAGDYSLYYGRFNGHGAYLVEVVGKAKERPLGVILVKTRSDVSGTKTILDCVREGNILYVSALEMPEIGESIHFRIPHGAEVQSRLVGQNHNASGKTQLARVEIPVSAHR